MGPFYFYALVAPPPDVDDDPGVTSPHTQEGPQERARARQAQDGAKGALGAKSSHAQAEALWCVACGKEAVPRVLWGDRGRETRCGYKPCGVVVGFEPWVAWTDAVLTTRPPTAG